MANLTKKQRQQEDEIKAKIMDGKRRGVCDGEGRSVKNEYGIPVAPKRNMTGARRIQ